MRARNRGLQDVEYEAECAAGIEPILLEELRMLDAIQLRSVRVERPGFVRFGMSGDAVALGRLRSAIAVYRAHHFAVPRPKALLGHQHFSRLTDILRRNIASWETTSPTLGIGAAGADSAVLRRLKRELADSLGLPAAERDKGELFLRLTRGRDKVGWEVLIRLSPTPLSKRAWRRVNVPGALNATVAYAMSVLRAQDREGLAVNLCSGTGTIMIEHALQFPCDALVGIESCPAMIEAAQAHLEASGTSARIQQVLGDARRSPLQSCTAKRIYVDLPFGATIGSHEDNLSLYPALLDEAYRLVKPGGVCVMLTHEIKLMRRCLSQSPWVALSETRIGLSGLHPRLFALRRNSARMVNGWRIETRESTS